MPEELQREYKGQVREYEESKRMPYVTSIERLARQEGRQEGALEGRLATLRESILETLEARFQEVPVALRERISTVEVLPRLKLLLRRAATCDSFSDFDLGFTS